MNILLDVGVNLLAALIGFGIGWLWQRAEKAIRQRKLWRFWKPFITDKFQVIIGRFFEFASFEPSGFIGVGDAIGLAELRSNFESLGFHNLEVLYADRLGGDDLKTNLILLGGPDANPITKEAVKNINSSFRFGNPKQYIIAIYDSITGSIYAPIVDADSGEVYKDYGIIIKTNNPFAPNRQILIVAGSFGYGTWAGIRYAISKSFIENKLLLTGKSVECIIEVDVSRNTPQDIRLVALREIEMNRPETS